ncbi:hypothetical protein C7S20_05475 [Christiangramia fulva]|uniref:Leucine-rich repeat domain-containing protein n=1 Tax=Christiangramia fulva TaxID=2126553 RepID=A0A2R3Z3D7_9FLAO|nr:leucine-rich repeat domain-containing protein [Christiangramia fulva]AVR44758.1 hypothetical protein C7S20_05475 [Christiangramia fulva]
MGKRKNGYGIYILILALVIVFLMAIDGSLGFLLSIISIPIGLIAMISHFSPDKNKNIMDGETEKLNNERSEKIKGTFKSQPFKYHKRELVGRIEGATLPDEIKKISDLTFLQLSTIKPIEISDFLNQNPNIRYLSLQGPFWFKNNVKLTLFHLTIKSNDNIYTIIRQFSHLHQLQLLELHCKNILLEEILQFCRSIKTLVLRVDMAQIPQEIFNLPQLEYLNISHNKIRKISEKDVLSYSSLRTKPLDINLSYNKLKKVPISLLRLNSRIKLNLKENPITTSHLKRLYKNYKDQIYLSYDQERIATRTFHPQTWFALKVLLSLILVLFPVIVFGSFVGSVLIGIVVWSAWSV